MILVIGNQVVDWSELQKVHTIICMWWALNRVRITVVFVDYSWKKCVLV